MARSPFAPREVSSPKPAVLQFGTQQRVRAYKPLQLGTASNGRASGQRAAAPVDPLVAAFESARAEGLAQGHQEGLEAGRNEAEAHAAELRGALEESTREIIGLRSVLTEAYRRELVELALSAAEAAMGRDLPGGAPLVQGLVEEALAAMHGVETFVLRVDEANVAPMREWTTARGLDGVEVTADPALMPGDFRLQCAQGSVEAIMSDRIDRVRRLVLGQIEEVQSP